MSQRARLSSFPVQSSIGSIVSKLERSVFSEVPGTDEITAEGLMHKDGRC